MWFRNEESNPKLKARNIKGRLIDGRDRERIGREVISIRNGFFCADFCKVQNNLESRLDEHFYEIGSSGVKITRDEVIQALSVLVEDRKIEISEFKVDMMEKNTALVRYKAHFNENGKVS